MAKTFQVKQIRSTIGCTVTQKETMRCLGLRRIGHTVSVNDTPANRGQIFKIQHLLTVEVEK
jgi:large subunit ribosomal protein L30